MVRPIPLCPGIVEISARALAAGPLRGASATALCMHDPFPLLSCHGFPAGRCVSGAQLAAGQPRCVLPSPPCRGHKLVAAAESKPAASSLQYTIDRVRRCCAAKQGEKGARDHIYTASTTLSRS
jgi:hypothetical protein